MSIPLPAIPGYQVERVLGAGGMAAVYLATHERLKRKVAIKVMANTLSLDEKFRQRFLNEAQVCAHLRHPNIIDVYDSGEVDGALFMVTEFMDGGTLKDRIGAGIAPLDALAITEKLAEALEEAHESRVWHRDIKPDNVLFDTRGRFVLADFGIAKAEGTEGSSLTGTGNIVGTPHYMSPEQFQALPVDGRSDIYSLGVMLYQMLTGNVPFDAPDMFALAVQHVKEPPPPLPAALAAYQPLLDRMLAKSADERFQNCTELRGAIRALATTLGSGVHDAPATPALARTSETRGGALGATRAGAAVPVPARRTPRYAALAALVVAATAVGLWTLRTPGEPRSDTATPPAPRDVPREPAPDTAQAETAAPVAEPPASRPPEPAATGTMPRARVAVDAGALARLDDAALEARLGDALRAGRWDEWESMLAAAAAAGRHPLARHRGLFERLRNAGADFDGTAPLGDAVRASVLRDLESEAKRAAAAGRIGRDDAAAGASAVDLYRAMLALDPAHAAARAGLDALVEVRMKAAAAAEAQRNWSAARRVYKLALAVDPENERIVAQLGKLPL